MLPFDDMFSPGPVTTAPGVMTAPVLAPIVKDFDPYSESLGFTLPSADADADLMLIDLPDGSGVQVEVNGRLVVTLMGCTADDVPEGCLTFEFED